MPVLFITAQDAYPRAHGTKGDLCTLLRSLTKPEDTGKPVVIMVHGFKYQPGSSYRCPHKTIFSSNPRLHKNNPRIISWPRHLRMTRRNAGHAISFGWPARGHISQVYRDAETAGHALAHLITLIKAKCPDRPIHAVGHSLGARVILSALRQPDAQPLTRAILLAPAEFTKTTYDALNSPAGRQTDMLVVTSRENDLFDLLLEVFVKPAYRGDRTISHKGITAANVRTLQLDHIDSLSALKDAGYPIEPPKNRICHWSPYLRPGVFRLYRAYLSGKITLTELGTILPDKMTPRWSRLLPTLYAIKQRWRTADQTGASLPKAGLRHDPARAPARSSGSPRTEHHLRRK